MDQSFESRVWKRALEQGLLTTGQINECLKEFKAESPTLQLTELLVAKGYLQRDQVAAIRGALAADGAGVPEQVRRACRDPRNVLGKYVILEELGRGGMGIVYKAWDGDLRRAVALKVLSGPWDAEALGRFRREAQSAAVLRHPNIITVYEIGPSDENPYIALEFIDGYTLHGRKLPARPAAELLIVISRAVHAAHRKGIIHRDLKPANIMIDAEGRPRVMDFGLAKPAGSSSQITLSGTVVGTPAYMSPEQAQGRHREVEPRSDVYSLGALLYELLTGRPPFGGGTPLETLTAVVERPAVPPRRISSSIPRPLDAIVLKCLSKDPRERYGSAEALAQDLQRFLNGERVHARIPRSAASVLIPLGAAAVVIGAIPFWFRSPPPPPRSSAPGRPAAVAVPPADRNQLDRGLRLMEESRRDLYRTGAPLDRMLERLKEAEDCFNGAIARDPGSGEAWLARAEVRCRLHRLDAALPDYAEAIRRLPTSPAALLSRGYALLERFMNEQDTAWWMKGGLPKEILSDRERARDDFARARQLSPSKSDLQILRVCLDLSEERYGEAIRGATDAIPSAEHPEALYKLRGDAHAMSAVPGGPSGVDREELNRSIEDYGSAIREMANFTEAFRRRGVALWLLGRTDEALADFRTILARNPGDSRALADIGTVHYRAKNLDLARDFYNRAIAADADNLRALTNRGSLLLEENRLSEARQDLERAVTIRPYHLAALFNLSAALYKLGDSDGARIRLDEILSRNPTFTRALLLRGTIHAEKERWKEALEDFEQASAQDARLEAQLRPSIDACRRRLGR